MSSGRPTRPCTGTSATSLAALHPIHLSRGPGEQALSGSKPTEGCYFVFSHEGDKLRIKLFTWMDEESGALRTYHDGGHTMPDTPASPAGLQRIAFILQFIGLSDRRLLVFDCVAAQRFAEKYHADWLAKNPGATNTPQSVIAAAVDAMVDQGLARERHAGFVFSRN